MLTVPPSCIALHSCKMAFRYLSKSIINQNEAKSAHGRITLGKGMNMNEDLDVLIITRGNVLFNRCAYLFLFWIQNCFIRPGFNCHYVESAKSMNRVKITRSYQIIQTDRWKQFPSRNVDSSSLHTEAIHIRFCYVLLFLNLTDPPLIFRQKNV